MVFSRVVDGDFVGFEPRQTETQERRRARSNWQAGERAGKRMTRDAQRLSDATLAQPLDRARDVLTLRCG